MLCRATILLSILVLVFAGCTFAHASCSVDVVMVRGRVQQAPDDAKVRVQLLYANDVVGESGEATIENGVFTIRIAFLTQSRRPIVNGILEKCTRRPKTVIVRLVESNQNQEYDKVSLDFAKDFTMEDPSAYTLRRELVLGGSR